MADISMCEGLHCPISKECYRHTAPTNQHWQAYFTHVPYDHATKECEMFWDNVEYTKQNSKE